MPLVVIHASNLSADQKARIGDQVVRALHLEHISPVSVVVLFKPEDADIYVDGGLVSEAPAPAASAPSVIHIPAPMPQASPSRIETPDFRSRARRTKAELEDLKGELVAKLQAHGALSSFQAQEVLGLRDCDWAPATLRRFFSELEEEGAIEKQGQKRGTRYCWKGDGSPAPAGVPLLVKKSEESEPVGISEDEEAKVQELLKAYAPESQEVPSPEPTEEA